MLFILMAILSSVSIFFIFKLFNKFSVSSYQAIVLNYLTAGIFALIFFYNKSSYTYLINNYLLWILLIGTLFFINFLLMHFSTSNIGMSTTSIACKISVIIPIVFSIIYDNENINIYKISGIASAIISIILLSIRTKNENTISSNLLLYLLPVLLFIGIGATDSMVKYVQQKSTSIKAETLTAFFFSSSFLSSLIWTILTQKITKSLYHLPTIILGFLLGIANFGSIFFLIKSLKYSYMDDSVTFGIINLSIITLTVLLGLLVFKEKLNKINWIGVIISIFSIILMNV